jgi:AcrR family transcriptional regulator
MAREPAPGAHDRILDTASRLFSERGVRAVGLQQVVDECGCGKNLLYREFSSKDDLVVAYLERCREDWTVTFEATIRPFAGDPAAQLVAVVRAAAEAATAPEFRGCPLHNTHAEFRDPDHPAHRVAIDYVNAMRVQFEDLAGRAGARDPRALADRIMLIIEGLNANGAVLGRSGAASEAVTFAEDVVRAATRERS